MTKDKKRVEPDHHGRRLGSPAPTATHLHTGLPAKNPRVVLTAVLADATNMGLTRMADACSVASYRELAWTAGWHLREDTYRPGLAILANAQQRQPLAALFGAADVSSSDGQAFLTAGRGEALGAHNARHGHGREAAGLFYTHVSARHAPYYTQSIPPSGEAAYVIDGLLYHEAELNISVHHTDGGGVSDRRTPRPIRQSRGSRSGSWRRVHSER